MNMAPCTCRYKKQHSARGIGKTYVSFCGKIAVGKSPTDDRMLCQEHINKVNLKQKIAQLRAETGMSKYELKQKGLI